MSSEDFFTQSERHTWYDDSVMNREDSKPSFKEMLLPNASKSVTSNYAICHPDRQRVSQAGRCSTCHSKWYKYKIDFLTLYRAQNGCCKLCSQRFSEDLLQIDHNHKTYEVRGLLCRTCNRRVGVIETFSTDKYDSFFDVLDYINITP